VRAASSAFSSALWAWPRCRRPFGLGAKRKTGVMAASGVIDAGWVVWQEGTMAEASHEDELAALIAADPALAEVARRAEPFSPRMLAPGFAGLAWVVTGQQISTAAGRAIFSRMETELGEVTAANFLAAGDEALRRAGQ